MPKNKRNTLSTRELVQEWEDELYEAEQDYFDELQRIEDRIEASW